MLPALSGLARQFQSKQAGRYLAGLSKKTLPLSLPWRATGIRAVPYRAPSWSWASIDASQGGSLRLFSDSGKYPKWTPDTMRATLISETYDQDGTDPSGRVKYAEITICGPVVDIIAKKPPRPRGKTPEYEWDAILAFPETQRGSAAPYDAGPPENFRFRFHADVVLDNPLRLVCILIAGTRYNPGILALVLRRIRVSEDGRRDVYERVGLIESGSGGRYLPHDYLFDEADIATLTII